MRNRIYKIKNKKTAQFWTGYGSNFSNKGSDFSSAETAAYEVKRQLGFKYSSINEWLPDAEIVEYDVSVTETGTQPVINAMLRSYHYDHLGKKYGKPFVKNYSKLASDPETAGKYHYAVLIPQAKYSEFREALKALGFSSRHYKKTDSWLWIADQEVMLRVKLLDYVDKTVYLDTEEEEYEKSLVDNLAQYASNRKQQ